jgi:hypothetical protein
MYSTNLTNFDIQSIHIFRMSGKKVSKQTKVESKEPEPVPKTEEEESQQESEPGETHWASTYYKPPNLIDLLQKKYDLTHAVAVQVAFLGTKTMEQDSSFDETKKELAFEAALIFIRWHDKKEKTTQIHLPAIRELLSS